MPFSAFVPSASRYTFPRDFRFMPRMTTRTTMRACLLLSLLVPAANAAPLGQGEEGEVVKDSSSRSGPKHVHSSGRKRAGKVPKSLNATKDEHLRVVQKNALSAGGGGMIVAEKVPYSKQQIDRHYIATRSPAANPLELVSYLPSMNVATQDTNGMQGGSFAVRGLTDQDLGILLNGTASTPASYLNQVSDNENIETIALLPGSAIIEAPVTTAAVGVLNVVQRDASHKSGGMVDFSYGTNNLAREFIRFDSGDLGQSGLRSYFSFSHTTARSWMGSGRNERKHIDFGARKDWENGSNLKLNVSWNNETNTNDNYPDAEQYKLYKHQHIGWGHTKHYEGPMPNGAGNSWTSPEGGDNAYKANLNPWTQVFVSAPAHIKLPDDFKLDITPYLSFGQGWSGSGASSGSLAGSGEQTVYWHTGKAVPAGTQLSTWYQADPNRIVGTVAKLSHAWDSHNQSSIGYWYENNLANYALPTNATSADGRTGNPDHVATQTFQNLNGKLVRNGDFYNAGYALNSFFLQNTSKYFRDRLQVTEGFKFIVSNYWERSKGPGYHDRQTRTPTAPLPHLAASWRFNEHHQIYLNAEGDFRQPDPGNLVLSSGSSPKPQYSIKEELGYRFNNKYLMAEATFFNYNISNRLNTTYYGGSSYGTINTGSMTSRGVDALVAGHAWHSFSPYASLEYLDARQGSNAPWDNSYLPTKGKRAPMAPHFLANFGLSYDDHQFFGNVGLHYTGPETVTLLADQKIPGSITNNLSLGYRMPSWGYVKKPVFKLNFNNLTGAIVRTGTNGLAINRKAVRLVNGQAGPDAGPGAAFVVMPRFSMTGSLSAEF